MSSEKVVVSAEELTDLKPVEGAPPQDLSESAPADPLVGADLHVRSGAIPASAGGHNDCPAHRIPDPAQECSLRLGLSAVDTSRDQRIADVYRRCGCVFLRSDSCDRERRGCRIWMSARQFSALPAQTVLSSSDVSQELKPLVVVVSPSSRLWNHQEVASNEFGAGVLLSADKAGYLFATAKPCGAGHGESSRESAAECDGVDGIRSLVDGKRNRLGSGFGRIAAVGSATLRRCDLSTTAGGAERRRVDLRDRPSGGAEVHAQHRDRIGSARPDRAGFGGHQSWQQRRSAV